MGTHIWAMAGGSGMGIHIWAMAGGLVWEHTFASRSGVIAV